jgi:prevent-host-death family protein
MKTLSVREAQHGFAAVLDLVAEGQEVEITRHRRPVARVVPVRHPPKTAVWPDVMARLRQDFGTKVTPDSKAIFDETREEK